MMMSSIEELLSLCQRSYRKYKNSMYRIRLPEESMASLQRLGRYYGDRTIADQVREAVSIYLSEEEEMFWDSMANVQKTEQEVRVDDSR